MCGSMCIIIEGAPAPFTAFLAVVSKSAGFAVFMRFIWAFTSGGESWDMTLLGGSIITMNWPLLLSIAAALSTTAGATAPSSSSATATARRPAG